MKLLPNWQSGLLVALCLTGRCDCSCQSHQPPPPDARIDASADSRVDVADAWLMPPWPPRDACDATMIELPPSGNAQIPPASNVGRYVAYADRRDTQSTQLLDIYLYDLETCTELRATDKVGVQDWPNLWGREVVFSESLDGDSPATNLITLDLESRVLTYLTTSGLATVPNHNGRFILYSGITSVLGAFDLVLWDRETGSRKPVAVAEQGAETPTISETHAAWVAWGGHGKDVFYAELETMEVQHVASTVAPTVWNTTTWGDYLLWDDDRMGAFEVVGLRYSTGEELRLSDGSWRGVEPKLRGSVVCMRTTDWSGGQGEDLIVFDIERKVLRRVTSQPIRGLHTGYVDSGWLVYQVERYPGDYWRRKIYAVNLRKLGIVDASGHVVPE